MGLPPEINDAALRHEMGAQQAPEPLGKLV